MWRRIVNLFRRRSLAREIDDEIRFHLEERTRRNIAARMDPADAAHAARVRFGSIDRARRGMRAAHRPALVEMMAASTAILALLMAATVYWRSASRVYDMGPGVTPPVPVARLTPQYTTPARLAKIQGIVRVRCVVGRDGVCSHVSVVQSVDRTLGLDAAAVQALRAWRFKPALVGNTPVAARILIDFTFALR